MAGIFVPQAQQKRDTLGEVLQGLQVAATGFGIYKDYKGIEAMQSEKALQEQKIREDMAAKQTELGMKQNEVANKDKIAGGFLDVPGKQKILQEGWREGASTDKNVVQFSVKTPTGEQPAFFVPPMSKSEEMVATNAGKQNDKAREDHDKQLKIAMDLRDRYEKDPTTQISRSRMVSFAGIEGNALSKEAPTGASDMSLVFQYMKMLDPNSTVREGEYASAKNTVNVPTSLVNLYNEKLGSGAMLSDAQRMNFYREAKSLLGSQLRQQELVDKRYEGDSKKYNVYDPSMVIDKTFRDAYAEVQKGYEKPGKTKPISDSFSIMSPAVGAPAEPAEPQFDINEYVSKIGKPK